MALPPDLEAARRAIERYAREFGLDFYDVVFEMLDYDHLNEIAAYGGFPTRYPHWRFGMDYEELSKSYSYGLSKIYELVINNNPVYAYLMKANAPVEQKLVMAHVFGHADFFKNNLWFSRTNRRMVDAMANHASRVRSHMDRHGVETVEDFIDACLSLENLIDPHAGFIERQDRKPRPAGGDEEEAPEVRRLPSKAYMEPYINPPAFLEEQKAKLASRARQKRQVPAEPQRDVLQFLIEHAPLENWQRDVVSIVRDEAYYFAPQAMTKILNEGWACLDPASLVFSDRGLMTLASVAATEGCSVSDGAAARRVYDRHVIRDHPTVRMRTRRGLRLVGSATHRVLMADGETWRRLDELKTGDRVAVSGGQGLWATQEQAISWSPPRTRMGWRDVARWAGVSVDTMLRYRAGGNSPNAAVLEAGLMLYDAEDNQALRPATHRRKPIRVPATVNAQLGAFLGYLIGDGHVSRRKRTLGLTTGDDAQAVHFARLAQDLFGLEARLKRDGGRWRVLLHSEALSDFLVETFATTEGRSAPRKQVPALVLQSPEPVVRAFLAALFDCDGYAGAQGVILSTTSSVLSRQVQLILLNYGILSRRRRQKDGCWHVHVAGASAAVFAERVGFGLERKQARLREYVAARRWFKAERWDDEVVALEQRHGDVCDISVEETHCYAAEGFINHNSYWHSTIMTQRAAGAGEVVDFADHHAGTLAMSPGRINPYKIGIELFRQIEERWNKGRFGKDYDECDDLAARRAWDRKLGLGRQKIFEVRKVYNDVMFIDAFVDEDFCQRLQLYNYGYDARSGRFVLIDRDWRKVKRRLLFSLTNRGQPVARVMDANHANRGELYLKHAFEGLPLDLQKARDTLRNLHVLWGRPVHLETVEDERGRLLSFDGREHTSTRM